MKFPEPAKLQRVELLAAIILTAVLVGFHIAVLLSAGPLWRDEISSLTLATKPSWSGVWATLIYDPFPAFFFTILRTWHGLFGGADFTLRILGFVIGLLGLMGFWISARLTGRRTPILALALLGLCPTLIVWGDSLRAYGLAVFWILIAFAYFWRVINHPRPLEIALTSLVAICSVQSIFTNAPLIFACGTAAAIAAARRRQWTRAVIPLAIGAVAALSLLPYLGVIRATQDWAEIRKFPLPLAAHLGVLREALSNGGKHALWLWICLAAFAAIVACVIQFRGALSRALRDSALYALVAGVLATVASLIFFQTLSWPTNVWYYLPMLAVAAIAIDLVCDLGRGGTALRVSAAVIFVAISFSVVLARVQVRASNLDLIASTLEKNAEPDDLIVIYPFSDGITFQRYYHGPTPWLTIPKIDDLSLHRWDLMMEQARTPDAIEPVLEQVNRTLRAAHTVWIASTFPLTAPDGPPQPVLPLRDSQPRRIGYFLGGWRDLFVANARSHAERTYAVKIPDDQPVSIYEHSRLFGLSGWKDLPNQ